MIQCPCYAGCGRVGRTGIWFRREHYFKAKVHVDFGEGDSFKMLVEVCNAWFVVFTALELVHEHVAQYLQSGLQEE
ncbi:hypothetical protein P3T76_010127 [Phytophthora citrophthora]|uniref:Uncharacterized protein n=1 Tax=Phytophthora citrophthora TaxID=4793 RepID=A0AAD9GE16_9STRA|nr:hypothetical protein P3T76_010127 [Phytophthora citrophthora]